MIKKHFLNAAFVGDYFHLRMDPHQDGVCGSESQQAAEPINAAMNNYFRLICRLLSPLVVCLENARK